MTCNNGCDFILDKKTNVFKCKKCGHIRRVSAEEFELMMIREINKNQAKPKKSRYHYFRNKPRTIWD